jgi:hypothetical protein
MAEDMDRLEDFEREETKTKLPFGWLLLYVGLILWGIYYSVSFTPQVSGWTQEDQYQKSLKQK